MTGRPLILLVLVAAACASPPEATVAPASGPSAPSAEADSTFDASVWLADVEAALADTSRRDDIFGTVRGETWDAAEAAIGLHRACDTYYDGEAVTYDPRIEPDTPSRGFTEVVRLGDDEAVVVAQCAYGAYQGNAVLVHVEGHRAVIAEAPVDPAGAPDLRAAPLTTPSIDPAARTVTTFAKARGLGDCGIYAVYHLGAGAELDAVEVRQRECSADVPDEVDPATWPLVYSAPE